VEAALLGELISVRSHEPTAVTTVLQCIYHTLFFFVKFNPLDLCAVLWCQIPPMTDYNVSDGQTYRYLRDEPLYPFGYGLSYSQFHYSNITINPSVIHAGQNVSVQVNITNLGPYDADEVISCVRRCRCVSPRVAFQVYASGRPRASRN